LIFSLENITEAYIGENALGYGMFSAEVEAGVETCAKLKSM
jgi:hypothetical protein